MGETAMEGAQNVPAWLIRLCQSLWKRRGFVWSAIVLNLILGIVVTLLFTVPATLTQLPIGWAFKNPLVIIIIFIALLAFICIIGLVQRITSAFRV